MIVLKVATRILAIVGKELIEVVRRPGALFSLVLGPFLIMALFGLGYDNSGILLRTLLVVPPGSGLSMQLDDYRPLAPPGITLAGIAADDETARQALRARAVDVVIVAPTDLEARFKAGQQSTIRVEYDIVNPIRADYALILAQQLANGVNQQLIERAAATGTSEAGTIGVTTPIPPAVIAAPTRADPQNLAPIEPSLISFFGPAVLALILQHLAVTLTALSLVRERHSGIFDVLRVSPVSAIEIVLGKVVAFAALGARSQPRSSGSLLRVPRPVPRRRRVGRDHDRPRPRRLSGARAAHLGRLRFGATGGAAGPARPARVRLPQRVRHRRDAVPAPRPGPG